MEQGLQTLKNWIEDRSISNFELLKDEIASGDIAITLGQEHTFQSGFKIPISKDWDIVLTSTLSITRRDD